MLLVFDLNINGPISNLRLQPHNQTRVAIISLSSLAFLCSLGAARVFPARKARLVISGVSSDVEAWSHGLSRNATLSSVG